MTIKKTYIPAKPRNSKLIGTSVGGRISGGTSTSSGGETHSHSNKLAIDLWELDEDGDLRADANVYSLGGLSAYGKSVEGGEIINVIDNLLSISKTDPLSANMGRYLKTLIDNIEVGEGGQVIVDWGAITGKPTTFAPSAHTHPIAQITGLQTELNGKWVYNENTIKAVKVNNAVGADNVGGFTVGVNVPANAKFTDTIVDISGKVDKVTGKSLIADSEILRLSTVTNQDITELNSKVDLTTDQEVSGIKEWKDKQVYRKMALDKLGTGTTDSTHLHKYRNVVSYIRNTSATVNGNIRIELPILTATMWTAKIELFEYDGNNTSNIKTTELILTGYAGTNNNRSVICNNPNRITSVKFGRNAANTKTVLLITTKTALKYPSVYLKEFVTYASHAAAYTDSTNYSISILEGEADFTLSGTILNGGFIRDDYYATKSQLSSILDYANLTGETTIEQAFIEYLQVSNAFSIGAWTIMNVDGNLVFRTGGAEKATLTTDGDIIATGGMVAYQ